MPGSLFDLYSPSLASTITAGDGSYTISNLPPGSEQGGDYFWVVKDNQPTLRADIALLFEEPPWGEEFDTFIKQGRHGDRQELRKLRASTALNEYLEWPYVQQVCCVGRSVIRKGVTRQESAYAITSLSTAKADAGRSLGIWRGDWGIENRLHYVRDVSMKEDGSQVRSGSAPEVMAAIHNVVIGLLRGVGATNIAAALRHYSYKPQDALALLGIPDP